MLKGVDLSTFQKQVDYKKLKEEGIDFAILRCGYGKENSQKDAMFEEHYKGCKEAGIKVGAYLYSYCSNVENAIKEAENCLYFIEGKQFDLPIFYDLEDRITKVLGKNAITEIALRFCRRIEQAGFKAGVYANLDWFENYIDKYALIDEHFKIWLAQWYVEKPTATFPYQFWQFTNKLKVAGLSVDGNYCENSEIIDNATKQIEAPEGSIERLAIDVINGRYGNGEERKINLGSKYYDVQAYVNEIMLKNKIEFIARNVIRGDYGNGQERKDILGNLFEKVQTRVNQILSK